MNILVDADACPVKQIIEKVAKEYHFPVFLYIDTSHQLYSDYSTIVTVSQSMDAVDFALINALTKGDLVITQDYGVATMALAKGAYCIHQSGKIYTNDNIEQMLFERHLSKKQRMSKKTKSHSKGPKKRTLEDDVRFETSLRKLIVDIVSNFES